MKTVLLGDAVDLNPSISLKKGAKTKFASMDKLEPFTRKLSGFEERDYKGGSKFQNVDTLLARITPCLENGKTAFVDVLEPSEIGAGSTEFVVMRAKESVTVPDYVYYLSISSEFRKYAIQSMIGTSGRQRVQSDSLARMEIQLPELEEQKKIGEILRKIDEKIEVNRRMNETLEQIGQSLFKHYFINNTESKTWPKKKLSNFADVVTGKGSTKSMLAEGGKYPLYGANGIMGTSDNYLFDEDLIMTGRVGTLGSVRIASGKLWASDNVLVIKPKNYFGYVYSTVKSFDFQSLNRGSTQPLITQTDIKNQVVSEPPQEILEDFEVIFDQLLRQVQNNEAQNSNLIQLRDSLLPRLISGKIKV